MNLLAANLLLALAWAAMAEAFSAGSVASGFVLGWLVLWALQPVTGPSPYFKRTLATVRFVAFMLVELVRANVRMVGHIFQPLDAMRPGIVAVPLEPQSEAETTMLAICITLTPGSLTVDVDEERTTMFIHVMDASDPDAVRHEIKHGFERRVLEVMR